MHRSVKHHTKQTKSSGISFIKIPIDTTIPWNSIPSTLSSDQWNQIDIPEEIEKVLTSRNKTHLSQVEGVPLTIAPLKYILGSNSLIPLVTLSSLVQKTPRLFLYPSYKNYTSIICKRHRVKFLLHSHLTYRSKTCL